MVTRDSTTDAAKIAYLLEDFLTPTTTFVTEEIRYLRNCGIKLKTYVTGTCPSSEIDPANIDLLEIVQSSRPVNAWKMMRCHIAAMVVYPSAYSKSLWTILKTTWKKPGHLLRSLRYFVEGIYLGSQMIDEGIVQFHTHFAGRAATAGWSCWSVYGIPYTLTTHAYDLFADCTEPQPNGRRGSIPCRRGMPSLLDLKLEGAERIVTISEFNRRYLIERLGIPERKIQVIRCGVDVSRFQKTDKHVNARPVVLSVGGLVEKKGHDVLLRACGYLRDWGYQFQCKIIGEGALLPALLGLRGFLHLEDYVHFYGRVHHSEILTYHKEADIFALACVKGRDGNMDGIPVALMEAMAMEIPVVTTNISGIRELVECGRTGLLAEPGSPDELAERLRQLLDDSELRRAMGRRGREKVAREYNQQTNHLAKMNMLLERLAKHRDPAWAGKGAVI